MKSRKSLIAAIFAWLILPPCAIALILLAWWWRHIYPVESYTTWIRTPATKQMLRDLNTLLESISLPLTIASALLCVISIIQQETPLHRCISRWLAAKTIFWGALWLSYFTSRSIFWWALDIAVLFWVLEATCELVLRIFIRYFYPHRGYEEVLRTT